MRPRSTTTRLLALTAAIALASGCASYRTQRSASLAEAREDWDEAVVQYMDLVERQPGHPVARLDQQLFLALLEIPGQDSIDEGGLIAGVLDNGEAEGDRGARQHHPAH